MIKKTIFIFQLLLLMLSMGCSSSQEEMAFTFGVGKYKFVMSDSAGKKIFEGTINVKEILNNDVSGTYEFTNIYDKEFPGLGTMEGNFGGNIIPAEKKVFINTNPKIADSNVFWNMLIKKNSVSGEWSYSVFRGSMMKGKVKIY